MPNIVGIDVGSQSVKVVCVDEAGRVLSTASEPMSTQHAHSGWAEQSPRDWNAAIVKAVRAIPTAERANVCAVAVAAQVDGVVALGHDGVALHNALVWQDHRAVAETDSIIAAVGADALFTRTGLVADASHGAPKMMWLRAHHPDVWTETRCLASVGAYVNQWLTGDAIHDRANASSTMLYDVAGGGYDDELCAVAGVGRAILPRVASATSVAGHLTATAADMLGLSANCLVAVGTGDEHAASVAAGVVRPGVIADVSGTAEPVAAASDEFVLDRAQLVETHAHAIEGAYLIENPGFVSGGSTWWLAEHVLGVSQQDVLNLAADAPPGCEGVVFIPALAGSTTPRWNSSMRGAFVGLSMHHDRTHLARAVLEGCSYALRDIVDRLAEMGLAGDEVRVVGGGGRSIVWCQIKADVLGRTIRRVLPEPSTAIGAAVIGGVAAGCFRDVDEAISACIELAPDEFVPDPRTADAHAAGYARYRDVFDQLDGSLR